MAHKKGMGSTKNGRDSNPKMLGIKAFGGEFVGDLAGVPVVHLHGDGRRRQFLFGPRDRSDGREVGSWRPAPVFRALHKR